MCLFYFFEYFIKILTASTNHLKYFIHVRRPAAWMLFADIYGNSSFAKMRAVKSPTKG
jgi:hypothetical protein